MSKGTVINRGFLPHKLVQIALKSHHFLGWTQALVDEGSYLAKA